MEHDPQQTNRNKQRKISTKLQKQRSKNTPTKHHNDTKTRRMETLMACFRPIYGWQKEPGAPLQFGAERPNTRHVDIPCGYCLGCRLTKSRGWAIRCMHEAHMHKQNCFITLTYDEAHYQPGLNYADFKRFIRRVVAEKGPTRYFMCGEYGEKLKRPHFHAILFGQTFTDAKDFGKTHISEQLTKLWGKGNTSVDQATYQSAGYVARYTVKKQYGKQNEKHYERIDIQTGEIIKVRPEFAQMSRRPGIGQTFIEKYWPEIYLARDAVITPGGKTNTPPKYYDKWLKEHQIELKECKDYERYKNSRTFEKDTTPERLTAREINAAENIKRKIRTLE